MTRWHQWQRVFLMLSTAVCLAAAARPVLGQDKPETPEQKLARQIIRATGVQGGLAVHLGCGDGRLTAALRHSSSFLVHGLDRDAANVQKARRYFQSLDLQGTVSADRLSGRRLPYVDNLVNRIVAEELDGVPMAEVLRVLAPGGVAYIKGGGSWTKTVKPRPAETDEWTHFLHDATNNAVSDDSMVGPPHQLQWVGGPKWARSHDHLASVSAVVSAGGRLFSIVDEGPIAAVILQPRWALVARDAFNGVVLWKRVISNWQWHLRGFRSGPSDLARRLVAVGDRVYVTLGIDAPVTALDAATGRTLTAYAGTDHALEIVYDDGTLYVVAGDRAAQQAAARAQRRGERPGFAPVRSQRPAYRELPPLKQLVAIEAATGRLLWKKSDADTAELMPTTLAVSRGRVFFQNADELLCLDARSGEPVWRAERPVSRTRPTWSAPTLVVYDEVVLSADRAVQQKKENSESEQTRRKVDWIVSSAGGRAPVGQLIAFSAETGERLWSSKCRECYNAPVDVLVAGGLVWTGDIVRARDPGATEGRDPRTGQVKRTRPADQTFFDPGMGHQRCYRNKATNRYLVFGRSGVEFIDVATGQAIPNHWTRGTCQYGVLPCNGLLYAPPHSCACFIRSKLNGFNCFAPKRGGRAAAHPADTGPRLERGPAYQQVQGLRAKSLKPAAGQWPTYRHDAFRSGSTPVPVAGKLKPTWKQQLGGRLSSLVVADGKVLLAQIDAHTVNALDARSGQKLWSFTAGGRVDSPPTIWQGCALFGCADGWVYCLRTSDGALAWRFRAAPEDRRIVAYGQLESLWPVPGSVLVRDGVAYCVAGRSSYLDGGIRLCRLEVQTGRLLSETLIDDRDPKTGYQRKGVVRVTSMPGALPDVLSCDGSSVFMRHRRFDLEGRPQPPQVAHLFSAAGFLDDSWWHRTYWMLGTVMATNYGGWPQAGNRVPAGRLLVLDKSSVYGFGRNQYVHHGAHVGIDGATIFHFRPNRDAPRRFTFYQAFAMQRGPARSSPPPAKPAGKRRRRPAAPPKTYRWTQKLPVWARAMILARQTLFLAGPPDIFEVDEPAAALGGKLGGLLCTLSADDGRLLAQCALESPPVFDGMAAAGGRLYLAATDGTVLCFSGED